MTYIITGSDEGYYPKIVPYLNTIDIHSPFNNVLLTVGFKKVSPFINIKYEYIPHEAFTDITTNPCLQAGEWIGYYNLKNDDIIIFTDGDIRMQRNPTLEEIEMIESVEQGEFLAGPNATHPNNTLRNELKGLGTTWREDQIDLVFDYAGIYRELMTLNMGVIICRYKTYKMIRNTTYDIFSWFPTVTEHMARQQWFMNLAVYAQCKVKLLPFTFHSHPHNGTQEGLNFKDNEVYISNTKVLFNHKYRI